MTSSRGGPYVKGAFLCETVIEGKDGVNSYIRVVDRIQVHAQRIIVNPEGIGSSVPTGGPPLPETMPTDTSFTGWLVLMFASGGAQGRHAVQLTMRGPDGLTKAMAGPIDVLMDERNTSGVNLHMRLDMRLEQEGSYEVLVLLDADQRPDPITRVFFDVAYLRR